MAKRNRDTTPITPETLKGRVMIRPREYAELTGTPLASVYKYLTNGQLRGSRMGNTIRIPVSEILSQLQGAK
jgi:excisionase family DNA binding protein